jgi:hypothetical protein
MVPRVTETTIDPIWRDRIVALASGMSPAKRCNAAAVKAGHMALSYPSPAQIDGYLADPDTTVIITHNGDTLEGYTVATDDRGPEGKLGGCQICWIAVDGVPAAQEVSIYEAMLNMAAGIYGWVWGRITNQAIFDQLTTKVPGAGIAPEDPQIGTLNRPG